MPSAAFADGFAIYEWSAGGVGMADAYMFAEDDPSLLAYNPAGITKLEGEWFAGGLSYINPRGRADFHGGATDGRTLSNTEAVGWVPNVYYVCGSKMKGFGWALAFLRGLAIQRSMTHPFPGLITVTSLR